MSRDIEGTIEQAEKELQLARLLATRTDVTDEEVRGQIFERMDRANSYMNRAADEIHFLERELEEMENE